MKPRSRAVDFKVGLFVLLALLVGSFFAFRIGEQTSFFSRKNTYHTSFRTVDGLRPGSLVNIAGVMVGTVSTVELKDGWVRLGMSVDKDLARFVRVDSVVRVASKGMLGDKVIDISTAAGPVAADGATLKSEESVDLSTYLNKAGRILEEVHGAASNVRKATEPLAQPELLKDVQRTVHNLAAVSQSAADPDGTMQHLMTDPQWSRAVGSSLQHAQDALRELARLSVHLQAVGQEVRAGDGTAHELIYGQAGKRLVHNLADATGELATLLGQVRGGRGMLHELIYEDGGKQMAANLVKVSDDLRWMTGEIRAGRGTVGRLMTDPSIYEDVKRLVGDLGRNKVLKALVRYSIGNEQARKTPKVSESHAIE